MILGHTIELAPNNKQATYFNKACGVARLTYNWALAEWQKQYQADKNYRDEYQANGTKTQAPKPLKTKLKQLQRLSKQLSRKQKGSNNREKAKTKLSRLHYKISCIRKDFLHKLTTNLVKQFDVICIENLNIKGMVKNRKLARSINDLGFYEFKRQLVYKANIHHKTVKELDRFYPSSKTCSSCGFVMAKENLTLATRLWTCPNCKASHDRDVNASLNILNKADKVLTLS